MIKRGKNSDSDTYYSHVEDACKPIAKREKSIVRRDGHSQKVRRHHLTAEALEKKTLEMQGAGRWLGPFNIWKTYWAITEALYQLGPNQHHLFGEVFAKVEELMSHPSSLDAQGRTAWIRFSEKNSRNDNGKDALGRMWDSIKVLQRLGGANPYGLKLAQLGSCINIYGSHDEPYIELRIGIPAGHDVTPINDTRSRRYPKSVISVPSGYKAEGGLHVIDLEKIGEKISSIQPKTITQAIDELEQTKPE